MAPLVGERQRDVDVLVGDRVTGVLLSLVVVRGAASPDSITAYGDPFPLTHLYNRYTIERELPSWPESPALA